MTIFFPDLSHYTPVHVQAGTVAVAAKATQATNIIDPAYSRFRDEADQVGALFWGYHWLNHGNISLQAQWAHSVVGDRPLMIDAEDVAGNTGFNGFLTVDDIALFTSVYRGKGGICNLVYLPHWYWQRMGSPSLSSLAAIGLNLVSSNYTSYSDTGPGWAAYGNMTPQIWQYTAGFSYGGDSVDFNAFRGSVEELKSLVGTQVTPPAPAGGDDLVTHWQNVQQGSANRAFVVRAQGLLIAAGFPIGSRNGLPDGAFGPTTAASVRAVQQRYGLVQDGIVGPHTVSVLLYGVDYAS